jgi:hypothetical protein
VHSSLAAIPHSNDSTTLTHQKVITQNNRVLSNNKRTLRRTTKIPGISTRSSRLPMKKAKNIATKPVAIQIPREGTQSPEPTKPISERQHNDVVTEQDSSSGKTPFFSFDMSTIPNPVMAMPDTAKPK